MDQVRAGVWESSGGDRSSARIEIAVMDCLVEDFSFFKVNIAKYFLKENVKWDLPEYAEMLRS